MKIDKYGYCLINKKTFKNEVKPILKMLPKGLNELEFFLEFNVAFKNFIQKNGAKTLILVTSEDYETYSNEVNIGYLLGYEYMLDIYKEYAGIK